MTDDTTSITTVSDDQIGSWEDRPPVALSHPPLFSKPFRRLRFLPIGEQPEPVCCTNVVHNRPSNEGSTRCDGRDFRPSDCCTSVVHKPSKTASLPSSRSRQDSGRRHSGLMIRGRVF